MTVAPPAELPREILAMRSKSEILTGLEGMRGDVGAFFRAFAPEAFYQKPSRGWSPAQNLRHLIKSTRPVTLGLRLPRFLFLPFGAGKPDSEPLKLIERYLGVLAGGYQAGVAFRPGGSSSEAAQARAGEQAGLIAAFDAECARLAQALAAWSESDLDRYRMPHPAAGMISVREMLFFTVFHPYHHMSKLRARLGLA